MQKRLFTFSLLFLLGVIPHITKSVYLKAIYAPANQNWQVSFQEKNLEPVLDRQKRQFFYLPSEQSYIPSQAASKYLEITINGVTYTLCQPHTDLVVLLPPAPPKGEEEILLDRFLNNEPEEGVEALATVLLSRYNEAVFLTHDQDRWQLEVSLTNN